MKGKKTEEIHHTQLEGLGFIKKGIIVKEFKDHADNFVKNEVTFVTDIHIELFKDNYLMAQNTWRLLNNSKRIS